ncbi:MAG TPA: response regulator transcription factor [Actinomycetota bacterium]|nr:response regulator transcription factor [Actinomycetota bacterium]
MTPEAAAEPSSHGSARVLVVDDESNITDLVTTALRYEGFEVASAHDGREALAAVESFRPDLMVLDVMLPDVDGFEVQRRLLDRGRPTPVVFLTARDSTEDKVRGLTIGGDDYVTKPFSLDELVARIRSVLRRVQGATSAVDRLRFADLEVDEDAHEVRRGSRSIELTATEFSLLRFLLMNPRRVLSKAQILDHVWHYDFGGDPAIVETYISYLRKKVDAVEPHLIHTVRGVGYVLRLPPE